ncbi:MAG: hypothetical protein FWE69_08835 [Clostridiales bacterium]|nr:hypothetical protein [Clostridiales bacterium]
MKQHGVKRIWKNPYYVNRKEHFCPKCNARMGKTKVSRIVNWRSPEAKDFDFSSGEGFLIGNIKFIWTEFLCPDCGEQITIDEMKRIEKGLTEEEMRAIKERNKRMNTIVFIVLSIALIAVWQLCQR